MALNSESIKMPYIVSTQKSDELKGLSCIMP